MNLKSYFIIAYNYLRGESLRNLDSIVIERVIIHILDKNSDSPIFSEVEQEINEEIHEFLEKHIIKSLKDDDNKIAKFRKSRGIIKEEIEKIFLDQNNFVESSKTIANKLFSVMKGNHSISSCDLVICIFSNSDSKYICILKMDYQRTFIHEVEYENNSFKISIVPQEIGLPSLNQKLQKSVFFKGLDETNEYDMIVLDKQNNSQNSEIAQFFIDDFLNSEIISDNREKTKIFKSIIENWTRKNLKDDFEKANEIREEINNTLKNKEVIDINSISDKLFKDDDSRDSFTNSLNDHGLESDEVFEIDKDWINKKMKNRIIKTDTGFEIKGEYESFEDELKYNLKRNGDGSVDIIIKNVRFIRER